MRAPTRRTVVAVVMAVSAALPPASSVLHANAAVVGTAVYLGAVQTSSSNPTSVSISMAAPGSGGSCVDATSGTALGTACQVTVAGTIHTQSAACAGTGSVKFTFVPSSGSPTYVFNGTLALHPSGGHFAGALLTTGPAQLGPAHLHFTLNASPCNAPGSQYTKHANGTFAGTFSYAGA